MFERRLWCRQKFPADIFVWVFAKDGFWQFCQFGSAPLARCTVENQRVEFKLAFSESIRERQLCCELWPLEGFCLFMSARLIFKLPPSHHKPHTKIDVAFPVDGIKKPEEIRASVLTFSGSFHLTVLFATLVPPLLWNKSLGNIGFTRKKYTNRAGTDKKRKD